MEEFAKPRYLCENFMYHVKLVITLECFRIVTHSHAASFSIKACFDIT